MSGLGSPPAGWFPSPDRPGTERYWDGSRWTDAYRTAGTEAFPPPQSAPVAPPPVGQPWQPTPYVYAGPPRTNGYAIAALVLSLVSMGIGSILAVIFGHKAQREIDHSNGTQTGRGMATAGIVLGWLGIIGIALLVFFATVAVNNDPTFDPDIGGINSDPPNGICNPDRYLQDPDC